MNPESYPLLGAHLVFLLAMLSFARCIHRCGLRAQRPWRWLVRGAWLLAFWNLWAAAGQVLELGMAPGHLRLLAANQAPSLAITSWREAAWYVLQMDHVLSVPALGCFLVGLKGLLKEGGVKWDSE